MTDSLDQQPTEAEPDSAVTPDPDTEAVVAELVSQQVLDARNGADLATLTDLESKIARAVQSSRAPATLAAYRTDWADFTIWCETHGLESLPATPATIAAYIADLAEPSDDRQPLAAATIERRKAALGEAHTLAGHSNPCLDPLVKQVSKGIRRRIGIAPKHRKTGLSTADLTAIAATLDTDRPIDTRDKALLLLGFATAMRRSELVALEVGDIENHPDGIIVHKRRSKTDQESAGRRIEVGYGHTTTCPIRALRTWLDSADIADGPVFRSVDRHNNISQKALSDRAVANVIKRHVTQLGHNAADFSGHSLRRGFSTTASRNGASERTISRTTGHTTTKGLRPYIEDAELFTDPPTNYLGL